MLWRLPTDSAHHVRYVLFEVPQTALPDEVLDVVDSTVKNESAGVFERLCRKSGSMDRDALRNFLKSFGYDAILWLIEFHGSE